MVHQATQLRVFLRALRSGRRRILGSKAIDAVAVALRCDAQTAREFIDDEVLLLSPASFVHSIQQPYKGTAYLADVFGHIDQDGRHWYVKLFIDVTTECVVMSFHPPVHRLRRKDGKVLKPW